MKPWVWLLFSALAVVGSIYLWKKPAVPPNGAPPPSNLSPLGAEVPGAISPSPPASQTLNRNIPGPRDPVLNNNGGNSIPPSPPSYNEPYGQSPTGEETNPSYPTIPPPPPPPMNAPFPDSEPPEFFDGDSVPPPFEPPSPLDEGGFIPPPPVPMDPEGVE